MKKWVLLSAIIALLTLAVVPASVQAASPKIVDFYSNGDHTIIKKNDGSLWRFGYNVSVPTRIELPQPAKKVVIHESGDAMILLQDGTLWMNPVSGQLQPYPVQGMRDIEDVHYGNYLVALRVDGTVWSWGFQERDRWQGSYSTDADQYSFVPQQVAGLSDITAISGVAPTLALNSRGELYMWAHNEWAQPDRLPPAKAKPLKVEGLPTVASFTRGNYKNAVVDQSGLVYTWGNWGYNHLGFPNSQPETGVQPPVRMPGIDQVRAVAIGNINLFLKLDCIVYTQGRDYYDPSSESLADSTRIQQIPGLRNIVKVDLHHGQRFALDDKGSLYVWGNSSNGRLGDGTLDWNLWLAQPTRILDTGTVIIDDVQQPYSGVIHHGVTMVPLRKLAEPLGAELGFEAETKQVSISYGGQKVSMTPGDATVTVNGNAVQLGGPIRIYNNETHVPLRFVSELFGKQVVWHSERAEIVVTTK